MLPKPNVTVTSTVSDAVDVADVSQYCATTIAVMVTTSDVVASFCDHGQTWLV